MLAAIGAAIDVRRQVGELTIGQQQMLQIAAAVGRGARIIVFDEPTSSLSQHEAEKLYALDRAAAGAGRDVHLRQPPDGGDLPPVRHGDGAARRAPRRHAADRASSIATTLVQMMIGRPLAEYFPQHVGGEPGAELLRVEDLSSPAGFDDVSFSLRAGEVLGFAGLVGAGRSEIAQALFGLDPTGDRSCHRARQHAAASRHQRRRCAPASASCRRTASARGSCSP